MNREAVLSIAEVSGCQKYATETSDGASDYFNVLPDELLLHIFPLLDGATFIKCRRVSGRWKRIIDYLLQPHSQEIWKNFCDIEYSHSYEDTLRNASPDMNWFQIYKNLYCWRSIASYKYERYRLLEFEIQAVHVTNKGIVVALHKEAVKFYNLKTLEPCASMDITGHYADYQENDLATALLAEDGTFYLNKKHILTPNADMYKIFDDVEEFILDKNHLYYRSDQLIFKCKLWTDRIHPQLIVSTWGLEGQLIIFKGHLYARAEEGFICVDPNGVKTHLSAPYSVDNFKGLFGTCFYNYASYVELNVDSLTNFISEHFHVNDFVLARIYNSMIMLINRTWSSLCVYELEGFKLLVQFNLPSTISPYLDVKVLENARGYDFIIVNTNFIDVLRFRHD